MLHPVNIDGLLSRLEKTHIKHALEVNDGHVPSAAKLLGRNRVTIYRKIKEYKLYNFWLECRKMRKAA